MAASARAPQAVPDYALQAGAVYRLEVGGACFVVLYLAAMALFLALDGKGFAELGTRGLKVERVVPGANAKQTENLSDQIRINQSFESELEVNHALLLTATRDLKDLEKRIRFLEAQTIS
jgi:flagellar motility protein MotE (MotC chaperone)